MFTKFDSHTRQKSHNFKPLEPYQEAIARIEASPMPESEEHDLSSVINDIIVRSENIQEVFKTISSQNAALPKVIPLKKVKIKKNLNKF